MYTICYFPRCDECTFCIQYIVTGHWCHYAECFLTGTKSNQRFTWQLRLRNKFDNSLGVCVTSKKTTSIQVICLKHSVPCAKNFAYIMKFLKWFTTLKYWCFASKHMHHKFRNGPNIVMMGNRNLGVKCKQDKTTCTAARNFEIEVSKYASLAVGILRANR